MDDLAEGFIKGVGRVISYILGQILFEFVFYYVGWPFVKILTFGKYPKGQSRNGWYTESREGTWTSCLGLLVLAISLMLFLTYGGST